MKHCPFERIRSGEVNDDEKVEFYYYSEDWSNKQIEPVKVRCFNPRTRKEFPHQILYVKPFSPGSYYYPKPDYVGSINYIELDKEIGTYHINNIKNGLAPSFTIHFKNGVPSQEERHKIRNDIERQLGGATNAGKFIVTYSDQPDRKPDFEPFRFPDATSNTNSSRPRCDKIQGGPPRGARPCLASRRPANWATPKNLKSRRSCSTSRWSNHTSASSARPSRALEAADAPANVTVEVVKTDDGAEEQENTELSADALNLACDYLIEMGEDENDDEWELIDARRVDYETEAQQDAMWTFCNRAKRQAASRLRTRQRRHQGALRIYAQENGHRHP